jgi:hypothetical protein
VDAVEMASIAMVSAAETMTELFGITSSLTQIDSTDVAIYRVHAIASQSISPAAATGQCDDLGKEQLKDSEIREIIEWPFA